MKFPEDLCARCGDYRREHIHPGGGCVTCKYSRDPFDYCTAFQPEQLPDVPSSASRSVRVFCSSHCVVEKKRVSIDPPLWILEPCFECRFWGLSNREVEQCLMILEGLRTYAWAGHPPGRER